MRPVKRQNKTSTLVLLLRSRHPRHWPTRYTRLPICKYINIYDCREFARPINWFASEKERGAQYYAHRCYTRYFYRTQAPADSAREIPT